MTRRAIFPKLFLIFFTTAVSKVDQITLEKKKSEELDHQTVSTLLSNRPVVRTCHKEMKYSNYSISLRESSIMGIL